MPFKPLSNALLNPHKAPFGAHFYNYLITKNLRRLLNNSFFHPSPRLLCIFCQYILTGGGGWGLGGNGFYKVHCESTHHHHPTFNPTHHQHSTFITQHPSPNIQPLISSTLNIHPPTPIPQHSIPHIINTQHSSPNTQHPTFNPTHHQHPTFNTHHPTFNPHTSSTPNIQHPSPNIQSPHIINTQHPTPITQHSTPLIS